MYYNGLVNLLLMYSFYNKGIQFIVRHGFVDEFLFPLNCVLYVIYKQIMESNYYNVLTSTGG